MGVGVVGVEKVNLVGGYLWGQEEVETAAGDGSVS